MNEQEQAFVETFIVPARRDRYLTHLGSRRHRYKILDRLNHALDLRPGVAFELPASLNSTELVQELRHRGAPPNCHVIADASDRDGQELALAEAVEFTLGHMFGVVLCCVPWRLACYKPESPGSVFLLQRRGGTP